MKKGDIAYQRSTGDSVRIIKWNRGKHTWTVSRGEVKFDLPRNDVTSSPPDKIATVVDPMISGSVWIWKPKGKPITVVKRIGDLIKVKDADWPKGWLVFPDELRSIGSKVDKIDPAYDPKACLGKEPANLIVQDILGKLEDRQLIDQRDAVYNLVEEELLDLVRRHLQGMELDSMASN